jgi:hypothetical protein
MLAGWIRLFERKTGQQFKPEPTDECVINQHGFFFYAVDPPYMLIKGVCGNGKYWESFSDTLCVGLGLTEKRMISSRSRKAWERKGWEFVRETPAGNLFRKVVR